jgi:hypothetical protein
MMFYVGRQWRFAENPQLLVEFSGSVELQPEAAAA